MVKDPKPPPPGDYLREDYAHLFERFFYFLEDADQTSMGAGVFDELERSKSHVLVEQLERYFRETATGRQRAGRIIPEPFFVYRELTTGIQLADLVPYVLSWGFPHSSSYGSEPGRAAGLRGADSATAPPGDSLQDRTG